MFQGGRLEAGITVPVLLVAIALGFWIHRVHIAAPDFEGFGGLDLTTYFYPTAVFVQDELRDGRLPVWNPYQFAGYPTLAAQITGVLYPPNLVLLALLSPARALEVHAVLHLILAGVFTWLFARRLGLGAVEGFAAGVAFMLCQAVLKDVYNTTYLSTLAWVPALLWTVHGLVTEQRLRWVLGLAVVVAMGILAGHTQGFVHGLQFAGLFGVVALFVAAPRGTRWRCVLRAGLAGVLGLALAAPQLMPTLELTREAARGQEGLTLSEAGYGWVEWSQLARAHLRPFDGLLGEATRVVGGPHGGGLRLTWVGIPLLLCGLASRRQRWVWVFLTAFATLAALYMLGQRGPVFEHYYRLPFGNLFRGPVRVIIVYSLAWAMLCGIGIAGATSLLRRWMPGRERRVRLAAAGLAAVLVVDLVWAGKLAFSMPVHWDPPGHGPPVLVERLPTLAGLDRTFLQTTGATSRSLIAKFGSIHRAFVVPDYEPLMPRAYADFFARDPMWHGGISLIAKRREPISQLTDRLDLMSVRYYATRRGLGEAPRAIRDIADTAPERLGVFDLRTRPSALPRAYAVTRVRVIEDTEDALALLLSPAFRPRHEATVESGRALDGEGDVEAEILSYGTQAVELAVSCSAPCLAVLTDLHYPGWKAEVDGERVEVVRVNTLFRGVYLEPGEHRVHYRYRPASLYAGAGIALAAIAGIAGVGLRRRRCRDDGAV